MNKFCTVICLILAINFATCNIGGRFFDGAFPLATAWAQAATDGCSAANGDIGEDDNGGATISATAGALDGQTSEEGNLAASNTNTTVVTAEAHLCLVNSVQYAATTGAQNALTDATPQEPGFLLTPGDRIANGATLATAGDP